MRRGTIRFTTVILAAGALMALAEGGYLLHGGRALPPERTWRVEGGDAARGRLAIEKHGCRGCHELPGMRAPQGAVGPSLDRFDERIYVAGVLPHTPDNLIKWITDPREVSPETAMPDLGVTEAEARDIAAYLYRQQAP